MRGPLRFLPGIALAGDMPVNPSGNLLASILIKPLSEGWTTSMPLNGGGVAPRGDPSRGTLPVGGVFYRETHFFAILATSLMPHCFRSFVSGSDTKLPERTDDRPVSMYGVH